jgi:hypothetical protein
MYPRALVCALGLLYAPPHNLCMPPLICAYLASLIRTLLHPCLPPSTPVFPPSLSFPCSNHSKFLSTPLLPTCARPPFTCVRPFFSPYGCPNSSLHAFVSSVYALPSPVRASPLLCVPSFHLYAPPSHPSHPLHSIQSFFYCPYFTRTRPLLSVRAFLQVLLSRFCFTWAPFSDLCTPPPPPPLISPTSQVIGSRPPSSICALP